MSDDDNLSIPDDDAGQDLFGDEVDGDNDSLPELDDVGHRGDDASDGDQEIEDDEDVQISLREKQVLNQSVFRHNLPRPKDGTLQSLRIPPFIRLIPEEFVSDSWQPSEWALENSKAANPVQVVRYRRDPTTGALQSNANIFKWSDGSKTIMIGDEHFEIQQKELAPRPGKPYNVHRDTHYYAAAAELASNALITIGHIHEQYDVRANFKMEDEAIEQLRAKMAASEAKSAGQNMIITTSIDPERQKKEAELAEKERTRAQRRRETAAARLESGLGGRGRGGGGLTIDGLEGNRRTSTAGGRKKGAGGGGNKKRRRNDAYDSDDDLSGGGGRQNDYDKEDDFIAPSDDEGAESGAEESEEEEEEEEEEEQRPRVKRQKTAELEDEDADADADADVDVPVNPARAAPAAAGDHRRGKRQIIEDDDDE